MCQNCDWKEFIDEVVEYLEDPDFDWAEDTLSGISETVSERKHATEKQKEAVANIVEAVERKRR